MDKAIVKVLLKEKASAMDKVTLKKIAASMFLAVCLAFYVMHAMLLWRINWRAVDRILSFSAYER